MKFGIPFLRIVRSPCTHSRTMGGIWRCSRRRSKGRALASVRAGEKIASVQMRWRALHFCDALGARGSSRQLNAHSFRLMERLVNPHRRSRAAAELPNSRDFPRPLVERTCRCAAHARPRQNVVLAMRHTSDLRATADLHMLEHTRKCPHDDEVAEFR